MGRPANAAAQPGIALAEVGFDIAQSIMATGGTLCPQAQVAEGQVEVVDHHQQVGRKDPVKGQRGLGRLAAAIDEGAGFQQQHRDAAEIDPRGVGVPLATPIADAVTAGQLIHHRKTDVVAGAVVLAARIADTEQDAHEGPGSAWERRAPARLGESGEETSLFSVADQARHYRVMAKSTPTELAQGATEPAAN